MVAIQDIAGIFQKYKDDVFRLAVSYTRSIPEAEDVCQTVFLKLMEQTNISPGKEKAWLLRVTVNECNSLLRSSWWKRTVPLEGALLVEGIKIDHVLEAVLALPPKYRVVVYLHYYEGFSTKEIGKLLRISQSGVTSRLSRARILLKEALKEE